MKNHRQITIYEYGIETCENCGKLRKRKAASTFTLRKSFSGKWINLYSEKGSKWTEEHIDCI